MGRSVTEGCVAEKDFYKYCFLVAFFFFFFSITKQIYENPPSASNNVPEVTYLSDSRRKSRYSGQLIENRYIWSAISCQKKKRESIFMQEISGIFENLTLVSDIMPDPFQIFPAEIQAHKANLLCTEWAGLGIPCVALEMRLRPHEI